MIAYLAQKPSVDQILIFCYFIAGMLSQDLVVVAMYNVQWVEAGGARGATLGSEA